MKEPKRPRKKRAKACIGSQKPAYDPPKPPASGSPLALARSALDNRPNRS